MPKDISARASLPNQFSLRAGAVFAILISCLTSSAYAATMTPITVSGFNRDVVVENTATSTPYTPYAMNLNAGENTAYYQTNLGTKTHGLPLTGFFASAVGDGTTFQLQPYTGSNALVLSSDTGLTSGTLTLAAPAMYSHIAVIANSGNGTATGPANVTLHFNDGSSFVTTYNAPDWFNNTLNVALQGFERINLSTGSVSGNPGNPRFYQTTVNIAALLGSANKPLSSISFDKPANTVSTGIYAVSGLLSTLVTLPVISNTPPSNILASSATVGGQVTDTGSEMPNVTLYWGPSNGGTNPAAWTHSVAFGYQSGSFSQTLSSLTSGTTYYYTSKAVNYAGTAWATPTISFTTPIPTPAVVTNLPASSVTFSSASLNGQILSLGGDVPSVTVYYGASNGGTNPASWSKSVSLGSQTGAFSPVVFGLSSNTTYYYAAKAVNLAGTSWATPSRSFTTVSTRPPTIPVYTHHNDNNRSGENLSEGTLNTSNVNTNTFGLLYTRLVDDQMYAQPLIATNVPIPGVGNRNLVILATVNDSVYAYDADDPTVSGPYWATNFLGTVNGTNVVAVANTDMTGACGGGYMDFSGNMGIVGTPVIDPVAKIIYLVVRTKETFATNAFVQRLHALDLTTGAEKPFSPVVISGSYPGSSSDSFGGFVHFDPQKNNQRAALTLAGGVVYIAWSSHCDWGPYHGWVIGYNASTLNQVGVYCDTPTGSSGYSSGLGGIWMAGQGPPADTNGNIFISTGNGAVGTTGNPANTTNRAMSFLKLSASSLTLMSWFTPYNWSYLDSGDWDLGAGGLLLIPGTSLAIGGGKSSTTLSSALYLVNRDSMGGLTTSTTTNDNIYQSIPVTPTGYLNHIHGAPVWWDGPDGSYIYVWGESDHLHQYKFDFVNTVFQQPAYALSPTPAWVGGMTGGMLAISANGTNAGTGILWGSHQYTGDANQNVRPGILHAYDAQNVSRELWNSEQFSVRDSVGKYAKYVPPTVANGKVYLATFSSQLNVYGLLPAGPPVIYQPPQTTTRYTGDPLALTVAAGGAKPLSYQWYFNETNRIAGATNAAYLLPAVQSANGGDWTCVITNALGSNSATGTLTVLSTPTISYPLVVMGDNPIAYWRLDEVGDPVAHDTWGGHDGQYYNVNQGVPGYNTNDPDFAAQFGVLSSQDSYVGGITGVDFYTYSNTATYSVEAWVNGGAQSADNGIVTYGYGGGGEQFDLDTGAGGNAFRFTSRDAVNVSHNANSGITPNNTWQHLVGVCDEPNGFIHLYVNGVDAADAAISGGIQLGTSPISIGSRQSGYNANYNRNFAGSIDEVAIYNYALSPAQVLAHYMAGTNPVPLVRIYAQISGSNLVLTWSAGTLQSAPEASGKFMDIGGATSPYTVPLTGARKFFRVRVQ